MNRILIASAIAVASVFAASQSQAASVTVTTTERAAPRHVQHHPRMHRDCMVKKVKTYRHGKVIVRETRVCR